MGYCLKPAEPVGEGIRRIAEEQVKQGIREIADEELAAEEKIHQIRKRCKKLRGLLRLVRPELRSKYQAENAWYRDTARLVSDQRDQQVLTKTFDKLLKHFRKHLDTESLTPLRNLLVERERERANSRASGDQILLEVQHRFDEGLGSIATWEIKSKGFDAVGAGLRQTFARGGEAAEKAFHTLAADDFHQWRKRVKDHWYHARLLKRTWPKLMKCYGAEVETLSEWLGEDHDLDVLHAHLAEIAPASASAQGAETLIAILEQRRLDFRSRAKSLGQRIYLEPEKRLERRWRGYWMLGQERDGKASRP